MLISTEMNAALNEQIGNEIAAEVQYIAIAAHFDLEGLPALAQHFYRQSEEERGHAMRFVRFIVEAGERVEIPAIAAPQARFSSAADAVQLALDSELRVTRQINQLVDLSIAQNDHISKSFLDWFVKEQLEEVSSMDTLLRMIRRAGEEGLLFVENYLTQRVRAASEHHEAANG